MELKASDRTQFVLQYVAAAIEFIECSRGMALPRARRLTRRLLLPDPGLIACEKQFGDHTACAIALHVSAFSERCRQRVPANAPPEDVLDQVLTIAIDHACQSFGQFDGETIEEQSHDH